MVYTLMIPDDLKLLLLRDAKLLGMDSRSGFPVYCRNVLYKSAEDDLV